MSWRQNECSLNHSILINMEFVRSIYVPQIYRWQRYIWQFAALTKFRYVYLSNISKFPLLYAKWAVSNCGGNWATVNHMFILMCVFYNVLYCYELTNRTKSPLQAMLTWISVHVPHGIYHRYVLEACVEKFIWTLSQKNVENWIEQSKTPQIFAKTAFQRITRNIKGSFFCVCVYEASSVEN